MRCFLFAAAISRQISQLLIKIEAGGEVFRRSFHQRFCLLWVGLFEHAETVFAAGKIVETDARRFAVKLQRILAFCGLARIEAEQRPVAGVDRFLAVIHSGGHVDAVSDAVRVSNDDRWAIVGIASSIALTT